MAADSQARSASIRSWVEATAAAVAAATAVITLVLFRGGAEDSERDVVGASERAASSSSPSPSPSPDSVRAMAVEKVQAFFVVDNGAGCTDITDGTTSEPRRLVLLGCTTAGGEVRVDLARFEDSGALSDYFGRMKSAVGGAGVTRDWHLGGGGTSRTGSTLEYIARGGRATVLWTYDNRGMTAMASRSDGDQAALNRWWASIGSFLEADVAPEVIAGR